MIIPLPTGFEGEEAVRAFTLSWLKKYDCKSFLDAGCGDGKYTRRLQAWHPFEAWVVDAHAPSLEGIPAKVSICGEMPGVLKGIPDGAVDGAICLDVIEHFEKPAALEVIRELERIASKVVVLFTPYGFMPQPPDPDNPWQEHKCGFSSLELHYLGYETYVWQPFDYGKCLHDALWAVKAK